MMKIGKTIKIKSSKGIVLLFLFSFALLGKNTDAQEITQKQANNLLVRLRGASTDTGKFNLLANLAWFQVSKAGRSKVNLDSARNYLIQANTVLPRLHSVESVGFYNLVYADYYNKSGQKNLSQNTLKKAIELLKAGKNKFLLGRAYNDSISRVDLTLANIPKIIQLLDLAENAFHLGNNKREMGDCLRLKADLRAYLGFNNRVLLELDSAKELYLQAKSGDWQKLYFTYSRYYFSQDNNKKGLEATLNALRYTGEKDSSSDAENINWAAAMLFYKMKDFKKSIFYGNHALLLAEKNKNINSIYDVGLNMAYNYNQLGTPKLGLSLFKELDSKFPEGKLDQHYVSHLLMGMYVYMYLKEYTKGQPYFNVLQNQIQRNAIKSDQWVSTCYGAMAAFCIDSRQYHNADVLIKRYDTLINKLGSRPYLHANMLSLRITLDTTTKNYKSAVNDLLKLKATMDSTFNETQTRQQKEMEVQFQTERKENENKLQKQKILTLTEQQKFQRAELKTAGVTRNVLLFSAFCAVVIAGLIYRQYKQGKNSNIVIAEKNIRLEHLLAENQWLLKEVHHRVKNNLQVITALLNSQSAYLEDGAALDAILKSKGRVESIALIHQKLYKTNNYSSIFMPEYIQDLIKYIKDSFLGEQNIWFELSIDPINLDVADAVPVGLIINESVTNAIKHAFIRNHENVIKIILQKEGAGLILVVQDNGKGFTENKTTNNGSFGLLLMTGLADELNGELERQYDGGTKIRVHFKSLTSLSGFIESKTSEK